MKFTPKLGNSQTWANWSQVIALLIAGGWVFVYQFLWLDLIKPYTLPVQLSPSMSVSVGESDGNVYPVSISLKITNTGSQSVLISNVLVHSVGEKRLIGRPGRDDTGQGHATLGAIIKSESERRLRVLEPWIVSKYGYSSTEVIAMSTMFLQYKLLPGDSVSAQVVHFASDEHDSVTSYLMIYAGFLHDVTYVDWTGIDGIIPLATYCFELQEDGACINPVEEYPSLFRFSMRATVPGPYFSFETRRKYEPTSEIDPALEQ
jgi:hypothetical protein